MPHRPIYPCITHNPFDSKLYVISVLSNPVRYESRWRLFETFKEGMEADPNVVLIIVEQVLGEEPFMLTEHGNPNHVQIRGGSETEVWVKESLINAGFRQLERSYPNWKYAAWVDADIEFCRADWAVATIHALQTWKIVQPWARAIDMGPHKSPIGQAESFCRTHIHNSIKLEKGEEVHYTGRVVDGVYIWHPGYAWALRREVWENVGPFMDFCVLGAGDYHMAFAFIGNIDMAIDPAMTESYKRRCHEFQARCDEFLEQDVGYVEGTILHHWHGKKRERFYLTRRQVLIKTKFDPDRDLKYTHQGVLVLTGKNIALRDAIRRYFRSRNEDSIDME